MIGSFGATSAAGKLLRLDFEKMGHALGITASMAAGVQEQFGTHCKSFHAGRANENGVKAALLARGGFTSARSALEGKLGYINLVADEYDLAKIDNFCNPWGIIESTFIRGINLKKHPVCASGLGAVEGMQSLIQEHDIKPDDVDSVECAVRPKSLEILMHHDPQTGLETKFSLEYWIAITLLDKQLGLRQTTDERVRQPEVRKLVKKVKVSPDPSIQFPESKVKIKVTMKDGRSYDEVYYPPKGAPDNPMSEGELIEKFHGCAAWGGLSKKKAESVIKMLLELETLKEVDELLVNIH
jgi:2-methylcitrate dehydratase PrpD